MDVKVAAALEAYDAMLAQEQAGFRVTKDAVFGKFDENHERIDAGMVVARTGDICPIWGDEVRYKSVTVVVPELAVHDGQVREVEYWLTFVHGDGCISKRKSMPDGTVAIRSDYMCW